MDTSRARKRGIEKDDAIQPMLTVREACQSLGVTSNTIRRWGKAGIIKEYRIGPGLQRRFRAEDIANLVMERTKYTCADPSELGHQSEEQCLNPERRTLNKRTITPPTPYSP